jgi:sugar lactone lactonase YvrE
VTRRALVLAALLALALPATALAARGDATLLALIPKPGFPASAYPHPDGNVYVGTYENPQGDTLPSRVLEYTPAGEFLRSWTVPGQDLSGEHGTQVATSNSKGDLVLLDVSPARALLLDSRTGKFTQYATFADLPTCSPGSTGPDCSPAAQDLKPAANYAAWGPDGSLYVTDYLQAVVWRVPPGGGAAQVWLADRRLDGNMFGTTGIMLAPDQHTLLVMQGSSGTSLNPTNPTTGKLYSVPIQPDGKPGEMKQMWESSPTDLPDGFGIAKSGNIYVALAGGNQIAVLGPDGAEKERFSSPLFDTPSSAKFSGTQLMVPNQSYETGDSSKQSLVAVDAGEPGLPELIPGPKRDQTAPPLGAIAARRHGNRVRVRYKLGEAASATYTIQRHVGRRWKAARRTKRNARRGTVTTNLSLKHLRRGTYRVQVDAADAAGNNSRRASRRFRLAG